MRSDIDYTLYLVTDRALMSADTLEGAAEQAITGGCTMIQLREKDAPSLAFYQTALGLKAVADKHHVPLLINDRADIAMAVDADGVHVGQSDLPASVVRGMIGGGKLLGVSVSTVEEAVTAVEDGADYIGVGAMYPTGTKRDAAVVSMDELKRIREAVPVPIVVIGGINQRTVPDFAGTGIDGLAVVSAVIAQRDIAGAAREMIRIFRSGANA